VQRVEFYEESYLDLTELVELVKSFDGACGIRLSFIGTDKTPLFQSCQGSDFPHLWPALPQDNALLTENNAAGMRAIAAIRQSERVYGYLLGELESQGTQTNQNNLEIWLERLRAFLELIIRKNLQLEALGRETLLRYEELNLLYEMGESMISNMPIDQIMAYMLEKAVETTDAQGGAILLLSDEEDKEQEAIVQAAVGWGSDLISKGKRVPLNKGIIGQAIASARSQALALVLDDRLYGDKQRPSSLQSALCVPLTTTARLVGSLILVNKRSAGYFTASDEKLSAAIATQAAIAIENGRLQQRIREEERIGSSLQRYVSPNVIRAVLESGGLQQLIGDRWKATIVFIDIRDFSVLVEKTSPRIVLALLNEYFSAMSDIIFRHQGAIDEFAGDQLLAFFGIPQVTPRGAENAIRAAIEITQKMEQLRNDWQRRGLPGFAVGIGMDTGWVAVGNIGSEKRMELTVIGPPVVIASRIEGLNKIYGTKILIAQDTLDEVADLVECRELGNQSLKGISRPIPVYEITGLRKAAAE
jgi:adenylate cyclase